MTDERARHAETVASRNRKAGEVESGTGTPVDGGEAGSTPNCPADWPTWVKGLAFNLLAGVANMILLWPTYISVHFLIRGDLDGKGSSPAILFLCLIPGAIAGVVYWLVKRRWVRRLSSRRTLYWYLASILFWWISMTWQILKGWIPELVPRVID